jgi:hypothetical protein
MLNDDQLLKFLNNSGKRVATLSNCAANLQHIEFYEAIDEIETKVEGSKVHFYGTRAMKLGHRKSHLNMFLEVGECTLN